MLGNALAESCSLEGQGSLYGLGSYSVKKSTGCRPSDGELGGDAPPLK